MKDAKGHGSDSRGGSQDGTDARGGRGITLFPVGKISSSAVIIRSMHERGPVQKEALAELDRRGLWLSEEQKQTAGLASPVGGGLSVASNAHAAATLASGPKSASVSVHAGASGRADSLVAGAYRNAHGFGPNAKRELKNSGM